MQSYKDNWAFFGNRERRNEIERVCVKEWD